MYIKKLEIHSKKKKTKNILVRSILTEIQDA